MLDYPLDLVARVLEARLRGPAGGVVRRVVTDSREVQPGDLFFALAGEKTDGHRFVGEAFRRGAVGAVVDPARLPAGEGGGPLLEVPDPLLALGTLAGWHRNRFQLRVVAVTGSVGKTTTKDFIASILSRQWHTLKSPGNRNTEIGLPLTLLEIGPEHQAVVLEMAMRGPGQIRYLARLARPDVAVITNIGLSHVELLGSREAIAEAKAELLDYLPRGGAAVLNADDDYFEFLKSRVPPDVTLQTFGLKRAGRESVTGTYLGPSLQPGEREGPSLIGARYTIRAAKGQSVRWAWLPLVGRHNFCNALAAAAVGQVLGVSWQRICRGLAEAETSAMRMSVYRLPSGITVLDDAYNASTPEAMLAALEALKEVPGLYKIAVLGSMLELGPLSEEAHRQVGRAAAQQELDRLITVGREAELIAEAAVEAGLPGEHVVRCHRKEEALEALGANRRPGDVILVKGSRGMAMESIVRELLASGGP